MTRFILARHGQSKANENGFLYGCTETPLSNLGIKQAEALCQYLLKKYKIDAIYSSPLSRAYDTVKGVADALGLPIFIEQDFIEVSAGKLEGLSYSEIDRFYREEYQAWSKDTGINALPGGEPMESVQKRAIAKLKELTLKEDGKTVLVGTHSGLLRAVQCYMQRLPLELMKNIPWMGNTAFMVFDFDGENFYIHKLGFDGHLENL